MAEDKQIKDKDLEKVSGAGDPANLGDNTFDGAGSKAGETGPAPDGPHADAETDGGVNPNQN